MNRNNINRHNTIAKEPGIRSIMFTCAIILLIATTSCQQTPAVPRPPISAADVKTIAVPFDTVSKAYIEAWNTHDTKNMSPLLTDDVLYYEPGNDPMSTTAIDLLGANWTVLHENPNFEGRQAGIFINRDSAFDIFEMWNYDEDAKPSSAENPISAYDWYTLRDGKIATMWLFWEPEFLNANFDFTFIEKPLQDYEKAWSSGDPKAVADLYAPEAVRHDSLFGNDLSGPAAIQQFATNFFAWYPGVRFERLRSFQLASSSPVKTGAVYAIHARDQAGKPCDVRAIILLEAPFLDDVSTGKLINEWMFYDPDSLIACGWAQ